MKDYKKIKFGPVFTICEVVCSNWWKIQSTLLNAICYLIVLYLPSFVNIVFFLKDGASDKQEQGASGSKPKTKVKSVDLPIIASTTRQLDKDVLNHFVEYEVSSSFLLQFQSASDPLSIVRRLGLI